MRFVGRGLISCVVEATSRCPHGYDSSVVVVGVTHFVWSNHRVHDSWSHLLYRAPHFHMSHRPIIIKWSSCNHSYLRACCINRIMCDVGLSILTRIICDTHVSENSAISSKSRTYPALYSNQSYPYIMSVYSRPSVMLRIVYMHITRNVRVLVLKRVKAVFAGKVSLTNINCQRRYQLMSHLRQLPNKSQLHWLSRDSTYRLRSSDLFTLFFVSNKMMSVESTTNLKIPR